MAAKKILIVDDEPDILKLTMFRIRKAGYDVRGAVDGQACLEEVRAVRPDLILLDIEMPKMNGLEVCRRIKSDATTQSIPVIMFTASRLGVKALIQEYGADGFILKPFEPQQLLALIAQHLGEPAPAGPRGE
jgi:CheY-like chemotaxis protein